ncbi:hypothetical protein EBS80_05620 [bacterium]|nr:hypothetical protein [bacterium]
MSFKTFLLLMAIASAAAWAGWIVVLSAIDPSRSGAVGFLFFYLTLTLALVGTLTVSGTGVRIWARRDEIASRHVATSFRQAFLFTALVDASLILLSNGLFRWWTAMLVILLLAIVELVFLSASRPRSS